MKTAWHVMVLVISTGIFLAMVPGIVREARAVWAQSASPPTLSEADRIAVHEYNHERDGLSLDLERLNEKLNTDPEVKAYQEKQAALKKQQDALQAEGKELQKKLEPKYPALKDAQSRQDSLTKRWETLQARILKEKNLDPTVWEVNPQLGAITKRPKP